MHARRQKGRQQMHRGNNRERERGDTWHAFYQTGLRPHPPTHPPGRGLGSHGDTQLPIFIQRVRPLPFHAAILPPACTPANMQVYRYTHTHTQASSMHCCGWLRTHPTCVQQVQGGQDDTQGSPRASTLHSVPSPRAYPHPPPLLCLIVFVIRAA